MQKTRDNCTEQDGKQVMASKKGRWNISNSWQEEQERELLAAEHEEQDGGRNEVENEEVVVLTKDRSC